MNKIGRKIYYEKATGDILVDTGESMGKVVQSTIDQDIATFKVLSERNRKSFDVIELEYGQLTQDFAESISQRVNIEKLTTLEEGEEWQAIEFDYPDSNIPPDEPVYRAPLSEQVKILEATILEMSTYSANQDERLATQEQALLESTTLVAGGNA